MTPGAARIPAEPAVERARAQPSVPKGPATPSRPLEPRRRSEPEGRFGHDFGRVSVHAGARAAGSAPALGSTIDRNGVVGVGSHAPAQGAPLAHAAQEEAQAQARTCAYPGRQRDVDLQPVFLRTGQNDKSPTGVTWKRRFGPAVTVWARLGVRVKAFAAVTVDTQLKSAGATDAEVIEISALRNGDGIEVFFVDGDLGPETGGGETLGRGTPTPKIVLADRGNSNTLLAHELGHVLGLQHPPDGADAGTIMEPSNDYSTANPFWNTIGNYRRITFPAPGEPTCLNPDTVP
jgi:hypothetical protein